MFDLDNVEDYSVTNSYCDISFIDDINIKTDLCDIEIKKIKIYNTIDENQPRKLISLYMRYKMQFGNSTYNWMLLDEIRFIMNINIDNELELLYEMVNIENQL